MSVSELHLKAIGTTHAGRHEALEPDLWEAAGLFAQFPQTAHIPVTG